MSVLIVGNFLSHAGYTPAVCEELAERLPAAGYSVIRTSSHPNRLVRLYDMVTTAWRKRHDYEVAQIDLFSGPAFFWAEAVCWTLRRAAKPYILTLHGGNLPTFAQRWPRRVRRLLKSASIVTTPSRYLLEQMRPYRADLRLLPNPLNLRVYQFNLRQHPQPKLIWLRSFHEIYNPSLAPKVISLLVNEFPEIHLTMVGPDKGDGSLQQTEQIAAELNVSERITLPGGVPKADVPKWLNQGDIFLNTTNIDNTPISVLEAMACGLCVVNTNVGGIPYLLTDGEDALLVPADDPDAMATAVQRLLTNPKLAEHLSRNARQKAKQSDWSVIFPQWERLLLAVARGQKLSE